MAKEKQMNKNVWVKIKVLKYFIPNGRNGPKRHRPDCIAADATVGGPLLSPDRGPGLSFRIEAHESRDGVDRSHSISSTFLQLDDSIKDFANKITLYKMLVDTWLTKWCVDEMKNDDWPNDFLLPKITCFVCFNRYIWSLCYKFLGVLAENQFPFFQQGKKS